MSIVRSSWTTSLGIVALFALASAGAAALAQPAASITVTLTGQSMIRSDIRATAPAAIPIIQSLLKGDVVFTNLEAAIAQRARPYRKAAPFWRRPKRWTRCTRSVSTCSRCPTIMRTI